jgi:hypothetical protein
MSPNEIGVLVSVVFAFLTFGIILGWATRHGG